MNESLPPQLEERVRHYERPGNDPGPLTHADWMVLAATGVLLPAVCLVIGWLLGWPA